MITVYSWHDLLAQLSPDEWHRIKAKNGINTFPYDILGELAPRNRVSCRGALASSGHCPATKGILTSSDVKLVFISFRG
jgi:hypothetical protein